MQLGAFLGIMGILGAVGIFLLYFVRSAMNSNDASKVDKLPQQNETKSA